MAVKAHVLKVGMSIKAFRQLMYPGQSLFWSHRPSHFPVQEMLSGRFSNKYKGS